jgi:hypothetical protein
MKKTIQYVFGWIVNRMKSIRLKTIQYIFGGIIIVSVLWAWVMITQPIEDAIAYGAWTTNFALDGTLWILSLIGVGWIAAEIGYEKGKAAKSERAF